MKNSKIRYEVVYIIALIIVAVAFCSCAGKQIKKEFVFEIDSQPPGALCTIHYQEKEQFGSPITVIGETPLKKEVSLYTAAEAWLKVEKRGFQPFVVKLDTARPVKISANLAPADEAVCPSNTKQLLNGSDDILVLMPRIKVIARGTLGNETSQQENNRVSGIIGRGVTAELKKIKPARLLDEKGLGGKRCNALWRDGRTAMEIVDPVRFSYAACPVRLETASGRKTALKIGREHNAKAVMLISGKVDYEQGSLVASKIGMNILLYTKRQNAGKPSIKNHTDKETSSDSGIICISRVEKEHRPADQSVRYALFSCWPPDDRDASKKLTADFRSSHYDGPKGASARGGHSHCA